MRMIDIQAGAATYRGLKAGGVMSFRGIAYACPPTGGNRFRPPQSLQPVGLIDATRPGKSAPQNVRTSPAWMPRSRVFETSEDCLNLNVFAPAVTGRLEARRPVVVHVFGGGFQTGSVNGGYQDDEGFVLAGDVVLVRPNMRTGALGFLDLGTAMGDGSPANRGLLDLVAALKWVHDNIRFFGGDPGNVTLVGLSSGAFTIAALFGMEGVAHLFQRVWLMSGSASRIIAPETATDMAADLLDQAGIARGDHTALQTLDLQTLLAIQDRLTATDLGERNAPGGHTFGIVLDGTSVLRHPLDGLSGGEFRDKQIVVGWTRDEARMWYALGIMKPPSDRARVLATIRRFHPDTAETVLEQMEQRIGAADLARLEEVFLSEAIYKAPAMATATAHDAAGGRSYAYQFNWVPQFENGRLGASHGFDEPFVFGNVEAGRFPLTADDAGAAALAAGMSEALYRFARQGRVPWSAYRSPRDVRIFG